MQRGWFLLGVFLVSGSVLTVQLLLSRIYSVTTWYHLSFLVISIAMFGMTLGAVRVYRGDAAEQRASLPSLAARGCFKFGVLLPFAAFISVFVPIMHSEVYVTAVLLPMVALIASLPFYFGGVVISLCLTRSPFKVSEVYGYDLLGAAAGCLVALVLMETIDAPSALIVAAVGPLFAGLCFLRSAALPQRVGQGLDRKLLGGGIVLFLLVGSVNALLEKPFIYPLYPKGATVPHATLDLDRWNSISRITLSNEQKDKAPFSWGASTKRPDTLRSTERFMVIDGAAGTPQTRFDGTSFENLDFLA